MTDRLEQITEELHKQINEITKHDEHAVYVHDREIRSLIYDCLRTKHDLDLLDILKCDPEKFMGYFVSMHSEDDTTLRGIIEEALVDWFIYLVREEWE